MFTLHRPDMSVSYEDAIKDMAAAIERDMTTNDFDSFITYDTVTSFNTHLIRKVGFRFRPMCDVALSPFHYTVAGDEDPNHPLECLRDTWGCFGGGFEFPFLYISTASCRSMMTATYQTNVPDIRLERMSGISDIIEFTV
jgi:hypothetical protein